MSLPEYGLEGQMIVKSVGNMNTVKEILNFLFQLKDNNNREWFKGNKQEYDRVRALWEQDVERLRLRMIAWEPELVRQPLKDCFYRIYRDIRFTTDKSPYKNHFAVAFSPYGRKTNRAAYYFQIGTDQTGLYGGIWNATPEMVRKLRRAIYDNEEEFSEIAGSIFGDGMYSLVGEQLKKTPKGFDSNHPLAGYVRYRQLGIWCGISTRELVEAEDWTDIVSDRFHRLKAMNDFINYSFDE